MSILLKHLKFYDSAKLTVNSTYYVDESCGTEERAIFSHAHLPKYEHHNENRIKDYCEHYFERKIWREKLLMAAGLFCERLLN